MRSIIKRRKGRKKLEKLAGLARLGVRIEGLTPEGVTTKSHEVGILKDLFSDASRVFDGLTYVKKEIDYNQFNLSNSIPSIEFNDFEMYGIRDHNIKVIQLTDVKSEFDLTCYTGDVGYFFCRNENGLYRTRVRIANKELSFPLLCTDQDFENFEYKVLSAVSHLLELTIKFNGTVYNEDSWRGFYNTGKEL